MLITRVNMLDMLRIDSRAFQLIDLPPAVFVVGIEMRPMLSKLASLSISLRANVHNSGIDIIWHHTQEEVLVGQVVVRERYDRPTRDGWFEELVADLRELAANPAKYGVK